MLGRASARYRACYTGGRTNRRNDRQRRPLKMSTGMDTPPSELLVIGANFHGHDSGVFAIDVCNQRAFGMSTERITRYKHDALPPVPAIKELIREFALDPISVRRVIFAIPG